MLSFTTAHVAVIALRVKDPDRERPYRMPWNVRIRGRAIPLTAVLGAIGTFAAWCAVVALHGEARTIGIPWMVARAWPATSSTAAARGSTRAQSYKIARPQRPADFAGARLPHRARADLRRRRQRQRRCAAPPS